MARSIATTTFFLGLSLTVVVTRRIDTRNATRKVALDKNKKANALLVDKNEKANASLAWIEHVELGDPSGPLVPGLVPGKGQTYEVMNREAIDFIESNEYHWSMVSVTEHGKVTYPGQWFARIDGGFFSNFMGWKTTVVHNNAGAPLFEIRLTKHIWNPTRLSWSFRIAHPTTGDILYTVNKDWVGAGILWSRDEWRIYRGHYHDYNEVYYCVSSYLGYEHYYYHSKADWNRNKKPVATASQSLIRDFMGENVPDAFTLKVEEGEDTALLLAVSVIHDMVYEQEAADERVVEERKRRKHGRGGKGDRERRGNSFIEQDIEEGEGPEIPGADNASPESSGVKLR